MYGRRASLTKKAAGKAAGQEAKLAYLGHVAIENRPGLLS